MTLLNCFECSISAANFSQIGVKFASFSNFFKYLCKKIFKKIKHNFAHSYLGNGWSDFLQILYAISINRCPQQIWYQSDEKLNAWKLRPFFVPINIQYSSQVTSPAGTCEYHNGIPCEVLLLKCPAQDLRVTAWITTSHASIFTCQQGFCEMHLGQLSTAICSLIYTRLSLGYPGL